ncbi:hypothetical protein [Methanocorpusculum vombati]|uniref:Uncharacterized protein n=1 Tax=Methanocorpusculum vombati TaxID=3002864 RepID=A0ABT4IKQ5_9EURY|nr:hypothetical protein [Methanocorpusculum vombati]MCZ9319545.1 hypothetical protein [Methanocorpusculum sp.]MCZ0861837.1 hypothetical protein [Methanocorpusculum vombati]MDE2521193.1 hypothetical protein [Methanocorpusculum sp.]MDE2534930.1 hypothetical protein [Methanocorpusculum sp.]MDE2545477.1 hypothetical protein [Methanocorpusculum sp.]
MTETYNHIAVFWDSKMMFHRLVEDACGYCEAVTPLMLAAPFYKGRYTGVIIPTGFGNLQYSKMLPALRAVSDRIEEYLEEGGRLFVYGAADPAHPGNPYDWLPVEAEYHFEFAEHTLEIDASSPWKSLFDGYDTEKFATDGWFVQYPGKPIAVAENGFPVFVECSVGKGTLLLASTHEYPSDAFLKQFGSADAEVRF